MWQWWRQTLTLAEGLWSLQSGCSLFLRPWLWFGSWRILRCSQEGPSRMFYLHGLCLLWSRQTAYFRPSSVFRPIQWLKDLRLSSLLGWVQSNFRSYVTFRICSCYFSDILAEEYWIKAGLSATTATSAGRNSGSCLSLTFKEELKISPSRWHYFCLIYFPVQLMDRKSWSMGDHL